MGKAVVGITTFAKKAVNQKNYNKVSFSYMNAISKAGGTPILIPLMTDLKKAKDYIELIDALILSGGQDISPDFYDDQVTDKVKDIDPERDSWEFKLFKLAYKNNLPILGVCRGMQLMNVAQGGTLYQDLIDYYDESLVHLPDETDKCYVHHTVNLEPNCKLCNYNNPQQINVNSHHHQAIKDLAPDFKAIAKTEKGIIEAIEAPDKKFVIGVQWHPEDLIEIHPCFKELFSTLINKASTDN